MKRFSIFILTVLIGYTCFAQTKPDGSGTTNDPWRISTVEELKYVDKYSTDDSYSILVNDISLRSVCGPAVADWTSLGQGRVTLPNGETACVGFRGVLDGQNHTISDVYIHSGGVVGLFYCVYGTIRNLHVSVYYDTSPDTNRYDCIAGGLTAILAGTLEGCSSRGSISCTGTVGGLVGMASRSSRIIGCSNSADIGNHSVAHIPTTAGGIVGTMCSNIPDFPETQLDAYPRFGGDLGDVTRCSNTGNISSLMNAGGICGMARPSVSHLFMADCKNSGFVESQNVGGLLGVLQPASKGVYRMARCFNDGALSTKGIDYTVVGLIAGKNSDLKLEDCYGCQSTEGTVAGTGGKSFSLSGGVPYAYQSDYIVDDDALKSGRITYQLQQNRVNVVWSQRLSKEIVPNLINSTSTNAYRVVADGDVINCKGEHLGTITGYRNADTDVATILPHEYVDEYCTLCHKGKAPRLVNGSYRIESLGNLVWLRDCIAENPTELVTYDAFLTRSISLALLGTDWEAIGTPAMPYRGTFDGGKYKIYDLSFNRQHDDKHNGGLFGHLQGATIKNLTVEGTSSTGGGGLLAYQGTDSRIQNCQARGSFTSNETTETAAGLVGHSIHTSYVACENRAEVKGLGRVGGVAGVSEGVGKNSLYCCASYASLQCTNSIPRQVEGLLVVQAGLDTIRTSLSYMPTGSKHYYYDAQGQSHQQTLESMKSGEVAFALGTTMWGQALGYDNCPVLYGLRVYRHFYLNCLNRVIASEVYYTNDSEELRYSETSLHAYDANNRCTRCKRIKKFSDGYYHISTPSDLAWFRTIVNEGESTAFAMLMADLDFAGFSYDDGDGSVGWRPIGTNDVPFAGVFRGNNHSIKGMTYQGDATSQTLGLFGKIASSYSMPAVSDLCLEAELDDVKATCNGILAGIITKGRISNVSVKGFICNYSSTAQYVAGLVGQQGTGVTLTDITNEARVLSNASYTGGVAGMSLGNIQRSVNRACVECTSQSPVGGIVGVLSGTCSDVANHGEVTGNSYAGGLVGKLAASATITRGYSLGPVSASSHCHAIVGYNANTAGGTNVTSVYYDAEQCGKTDVCGENRDALHFECGEVAHLLGEPWGQSISQDLYPVLNAPLVYKHVGQCICYDNNADGGDDGHSYANGVCVFCGDVQTLEQDAEGYYLIANATNLVLFRDMVNGGAYDAKARVTRDFSMRSVCGAQYKSWTPIGGNSVTTGYAGIFDGQGHTISDLYINSTTSGQGLFGYAYNQNVSTTNGATIRNLNVQGNVTLASVSGMLCAYTRQSTLENCTTSGTITIPSGTSSPGTIGGLCGRAYGSDVIRGCTNRAHISASTTADYIGGIVGYSRSPIECCVNAGRITVPNSRRVGGISGHVQQPVTNCGNQASVSFGLIGAGLVGEYTGNTAIANCFNTGSISSDYTTCAAIIPYTSTTPVAAITNCYHLADASLTEVNSQAMSLDAFAGGKVAYLLQQACDEPTWGQTLDGEQISPQLGGTPVVHHEADLPDWVSNNKGVPNSVARSDWALYTTTHALVKVTLDWTVSCESTDHLWIGAGKNDDLVMGVSGQQHGHAEHEEFCPKTFGLYIGYAKDASIDDYDDEATVSNIHLEWYSNAPHYYIRNLSILPGDINADGRRTVGDVARLMAILHGKLTDANYAADINYDGIVDLNDVDDLIKVVKQSY